MSLRVVQVIREGLSKKVLASVVASGVAVIVSYLARKGVVLGPDVELALSVIGTAALTFLVGYLVPEKAAA